MAKQIYPSHLYEPIRREVAVSYLRHEFRKLFPSIRDARSLKLIDNDIAHWFNDNPELAPVRDFWNGLHGISMGFKLKNIVTHLTAKNIRWQRNKVLIEELYFGANFDELKPVGPNPQVSAVREWYFDSKNKASLQLALKHHALRSSQSAPRDTDPVIIIPYGKNQHKILDGNRRVMRSILLKKPYIEAFVAKSINDKPLEEFWVPTSTMIDIIFAHRFFYSPRNKGLTTASAKILSDLTAHSSVGRYELSHRCLNQRSIPDQKLFQAIKVILKKQHKSFQWPPQV